LTTGNIVFPGATGDLIGSSSLFWDNTNLIHKLTQDGSFKGYYQVASCGQTTLGNANVVSKFTPTDGFGTASNFVDYNLAIHRHANVVGTRQNDVGVWGWNTGYADANFRENTSLSAIYNQYESFYHPTSGDTLQEWHVVWVNPAGSFYARPFTAICDEVTNNIITRIGTNSHIFQKPDGGAGGTGTAFLTLEPSRILYAPIAITSGTASAAWEFVFPSHTGLTASTPYYDILTDGGTVQWATGNFTTQGFITIAQRQISFVGASTITNAAAFVIAGQPLAGTNATLTNSYALWTQAGNVRFDGIIECLGTLAARGSGNLQFQAVGTNIAYFSGTNANFLWNSDNTFDIGAVGANRPRSIYVGTQFYAGTDGAAAPGFSWGAETNSGLYRVGAGIFGWSIAGALKHIIQGSQYNIRDNAALFVMGASDDLTFGRAAAGSMSIGGQANGQTIAVSTLTELTTIAAAATTDTAIQIPVNAVVFAVSVRVTTVIPTAATFTVTGTSSGTQFDVAGGVSTAATTTDVGTRNCPFKNGAAQTIRITPNINPANNSGRVRVTIHYYQITAATS
jgi:hypothetical protein